MLLLPIESGHKLARRLHWVDVARGIGIVLVVYGHALRAQMVGGQSDPAWRASLQDDMIYAFHMHLFFFLAGLFVAGSIAKGPGSFIRTKLTTIAYPYILWSLISALLGVLAGGAANYAMDLSQFAGIWHKPIYQYWFLYALLICDIVALTIGADRRIAAALALLSVAGVFAALPGILWIASNYFSFFFGALVLGPAILSVRLDMRVVGGIAVAGAAFFIISFWQADIVSAFAGDTLVALVRGVLGVATVLAVSMLIGARAPWLAVIGTASMTIYVMHTIFSAGLRIVLTSLGVQSPTLLLVACTVIGLIVPLAFWAIARQFGLLTWLGLGVDSARAKKVPA